MNTRESQIEQARRLIATGISEDLKEVLEQQYPELKESEDERIRQTLIDMVKRETGFTGFPSQGQVLAYLEKQKEQKPSTPEDIAAAYQMGLAEGRREQKPAEWSEEDEKNLRQCIEIVGGWEVDYDYANPHYSNWLKSLRPQPYWKPLPEQLEALVYAIEGKWDMIKPTSYLSRMLEDLYDGLVNTYNIDENSEYIYPEDKK